MARINPIVAEDVAAILAAPLPWEFFDGATVLVTGAAGLLPSYMVEVLLGMKPLKGFGPARVVGLVRTLDKARARFAPYLDRPELELVHGDVTAPPELGRPDVIIHAASIANARQMAENPAGTLSANLLGTHHMLELARAAGAKNFLFFSSGEVCGNPEPHQLPMREDVYCPLDPTGPRSCYAEGKRGGEAMCAAWTRQYGLETRIVRPFHTYGPGMDLAGGWVYSDFVNDIMARRPLLLRSDGLDTRSFCYIGDAVRGYFTVMMKGQSATPYNIGTKVETSIRDLALILVDEFQERGLSLVIDAPTLEGPRPPIKRSVPDISRLESLGFSPATTIAHGFRRTVRSYEEFS